MGFDIDESGDLTIKELVDGFSYLQEGLNTKHIANVRCALKRADVQTTEVMGKFDEEVRRQEQRQEEVLRIAREQEEQMHTQWLAFLGQQHKDAVNTPDGRITGEQGAKATSSFQNGISRMIF